MKNKHKEKKNDNLKCCKISETTGDESFHVGVFCQQLRPGQKVTKKAIFKPKSTPYSVLVLKDQISVQVAIAGVGQCQVDGQTRFQPPRSERNKGKITFD